MQDYLHSLLRLHGVRAFYTTRGDVGAEPGPYDGFNVCHYTGDDPGHVDGCRRALAERLGVSADCIIIPRQTHSSEVATVMTPGVMPESVDGLVTDRPGIVIGVNTADCVPVVMADADARVIGVAHAGWRGAVGGIVENTLSAMVSLGAAPTRVAAAFGPSVCAGCFEVGDEVAARFPDAAVMRRAEWPRPHVDLHAHIASVLVGAGVPRSSIALPGPLMCTRCSPSVYFSARAAGISSGRVFTFAYLD